MIKPGSKEYTEERGQIRMGESASGGCGGCCADDGARKKMRPEKEFKDLMNRLKRIEGQVRGVEGLLEKDAYCPDILVQVSAINSALNSFNKVLLASHIRSCVAEDIRRGEEESVDELVCLLQKLMK